MTIDIEAETKKFFEGMPLRDKFMYSDKEWRFSVRGEPQSLITWQVAQQITKAALVEVAKKEACVLKAATACAVHHIGGMPSMTIKELSAAHDEAEQRLKEWEEL